MDALRLEVRKDGFSQLQSGSYKLTVTLNPTDLDDNSQNLLMDFIKAPMGAVYMLGMARVDVDTGEPAKTHTAAPEKPKKRFYELPYSQQAALRCREGPFIDFLEDQHPTAWVTVDQSKDRDYHAADVVRWICCNGGSRAALDTSDVMAARWQSLNGAFEVWAGLVPEQR